MPNELYLTIHKGAILITVLDKGKPVESRGRKAMGLKLETVRIARLPGFLFNASRCVENPADVELKKFR